MKNIKVLYKLIALANKLDSRDVCAADLIDKTISKIAYEFEKDFSEDMRGELSDIKDMKLMFGPDYEQKLRDSAKILKERKEKGNGKIVLELAPSKYSKGPSEVIFDTIEQLYDYIKSNPGLTDYKIKRKT